MQFCLGWAACLPISLYPGYADRGRTVTPCVSPQCAQGGRISLPLLFRQRCPAKTVRVRCCYPTWPQRKCSRRVMDCPRSQLSAPRAESYACQCISFRVIRLAARGSAIKRHAGYQLFTTPHASLALGPSAILCSTNNSGRNNKANYSTVVVDASVETAGLPYYPPTLTKGK